MDFNKAGQLIALYEQGYFTGGSFSESTIRDDLQTRKASDAYAKMAGRWSNELDKKKSFYIQEFSNGLSTIKTILDAVRTHQSWDTMLISRCEKCINQANKLHDIVRNF